MRNFNGAFGSAQAPESTSGNGMNRFRCLSGAEGSALTSPEQSVVLSLSKFRRGRSCHVLLFVLMSISAVFALPEGIGDFDINKVRAAVTTTDSNSTTLPAKAGEEEKLSVVVLRIILYLGIVIALILGCAWFFKRRGLQAKSGSGAMDIIETMPLGQNRTLLMVRILDEIYLLSQTPSAITMIDKIGGQKALDIISSSKGGAGAMIHFKDAFNSFMGKIRKSS